MKERLDMKQKQKLTRGDLVKWSCDEHVITGFSEDGKRAFIRLVQKFDAVVPVKELVLMK